MFDANLVKVVNALCCNEVVMGWLMTPPHLSLSVVGSFAGRSACLLCAVSLWSRSSPRHGVMSAATHRAAPSEPAGMQSC